MKALAIGLMSGTSLDGLDICLAEFEKQDKWIFQILKTETLPYSSEWENKLKNSIYFSAEELLELHSNYGFYLGQQVKNFMNKYQLQNIDVVASHGHTVFHQPQKQFTLQIGDGRAIKLETGLPVVYDFRSQDVLMKGNGAPLVPIGDQLLFSEYTACLNLGGFSNISLESDQKRIAFDICPVNIILNRLAQQLGESFDQNGDMARKGKMNQSVLRQLNALDFYQQPHPKSLGVEWCNQHVFPLFENVDSLDSLATFTEHIALQISNVINTHNIKDILFTGGGAYNSFLVEKIKAKTKSEIIIPAKEIIEYKEALIFAFMGVLKMNNEINVLSSATGSTSDHCSGVVA
nr:anhydro-N-acetylmuramic acid kinase [uncultured Chryseobacterium sp.]